MGRNGTMGFYYVCMCMCSCMRVYVYKYVRILNCTKFVNFF